MTHTPDPVCPLCEEKLKTADLRLVHWFLEARKEFQNLHIAWSWRSKEEQESAFQEGRTRAHFPHSKHNHMENGKPCSLALDVFQIQNGRVVFCPSFYFKLNELSQKMGYSIIWGGSFSTLKDNDHYEIVSH